MQVLVETAMFAAVGGLLYSIASVLRLQGYMGYLLPLPIVLSAMRSGPRIAFKTTTATCMLLLGTPSAHHTMHGQCHKKLRIKQRCMNLSCTMRSGILHASLAILEPNDPYARWVLSSVSINFPLDRTGSSYSNFLTVSTLGSETEYNNEHRSFLLA